MDTTEKPPIKILALCDGMGCGKITFDELGIKTEYHSVEIDKHVRKLADSNLKGIIRWAHDVKAVTEKQIVEHGPCDWVLFGSPCQSVSVAGKYCGDDSLAWIQDKSGVLVDCLRILRWAQKQNPSLKFMIENVKMKKVFLEQFNAFIGCEPTLINSALVSAQNRNRYYWTNFPVSQPVDRQIVLKDIICQEDFTDREKSRPIGATEDKASSLHRYFEKSGRQIVFGWSKSTRYKDKNGKVWSNPSPERERYIEERLNLGGKSNTLTCGDGCRNQSTMNLVVQVNPSKECGGKQPYMQNRIYDTSFKSPVVTSSFTDRLKILLDIKSGEIQYRKLTVAECAGLQTIPEWYLFDAVSKSQAYKAIGNGWTIEVTKHIIQEGNNLECSNFMNPCEYKPPQLDLGI